MEFNDENQYRKKGPAPKVQPWPIKLALKYGAKSEQQANIIVIVISFILIIITVIMYKNLFFSSNNNDADVEDLPTEVRLDMEASGIDL